MFIINAPTIFTVIWAVVKQMLNKNTVAKISILGASYCTELLEEIDADNLPEKYGGNCTLNFDDNGPWNDGTVEGYPDEFWESFRKRDGY
jgi:hypothetical protein